MKTIVHPNFSKKFQTTLLITWTGSVFCFGMGLLYYRLHHVICLDCGGQTQSVKDKETHSKWVANCQKCQIRWDLQIGVADA